MMIERDEVVKHIEAARSLKNGRRFYDMHVHPHDIVYNRQVYHRVSDHPGRYSVPNIPYHPPELGRLPLSPQGSGPSISDDWRVKIFNMTLRRTYAHTGPTVFADHMDLSGIDEVLLLPVPGQTGPFMEQMAVISDIFSGHTRCHMAGSVPTDTPIAHISSHIREMLRRFGIRAIKLHPNASGLDLSRSTAKEWLEGVLSACNDHGLPLILHAGRNSVLPCREAAAYADIDHFDGIDWSITTMPVVFAHAGIYCCDTDDIDRRIFPKLKRLFQTHGHLLVDIADLQLNAMEKVLHAIDPERILFGSDALYADQWAMVVTLMLALSKCCSDPEARFLTIISENPQQYIFREDFQAEAEVFDSSPGRHSAEPALMMTHG